MTGHHIMLTGNEITCCYQEATQLVSGTQTWHTLSMVTQAEPQAGSHLQV